MMHIAKLQDEVGGTGGKEFFACAEGRVRGFYIRCGAWIDAVQVVYTNIFGQADSTQRCGGQGGALKTFMLESNERITRITFTASRYINSICIETNLNNRIVFGEENGERFVFEIPENSEFAGFYGKCDAYLDSIGVLISSRFTSGQAGL